MWVLGLSALAQPADLDALVTHALERDPNAMALQLERDAAVLRAQAARRPVDPQVGLQLMALGAPADAMFPPMGMVEVTQMLRGAGEGRALAARQEIAGDRLTAERTRTRADLRLRLGQGAARLAAAQQELALLDEQIEAARVLLEVGLRRYRTGADGGGAAPASPRMPPMDAPATPGMGAPGTPPSGGMPGMGGGSGAGGAAGMGGMAGMGGAAGGAPAAGGVAPPILLPMDMAPMDGAAMGGMPLGPGGALAALMRLQAEVARLHAEAAGLRAQQLGWQSELALYLEPEVLRPLLTAPERYVVDPAPPEAAPELQLARLGIEAAQAEVTLARAVRRPDVMLGLGQRFMPDGELAGTDVMVGVTLPVWGAHTRAIRAAEVERTAAQRREQGVVRAVEEAATAARAASQAAEARADALERHAVPAARAAFELARRAFAVDRVGLEEVVLAWDAWVSIAREAVAARRDARLRAAELARLFVEPSPPREQP